MFVTFFIWSIELVAFDKLDSHCAFVGELYVASRVSKHFPSTSQSLHWCEIVVQSPHLPKSLDSGWAEYSSLATGRPIIFKIEKMVEEIHCKVKRRAKNNLFLFSTSVKFILVFRAVKAHPFWSKSSSHREILYPPLLTPNVKQSTIRKFASTALLNQLLEENLR